MKPWLPRKQVGTVGLVEVMSLALPSNCVCLIACFISWERSGTMGLPGLGLPHLFTPSHRPLWITSTPLDRSIVQRSSSFAPLCNVRPSDRTYVGMEKPSGKKGAKSWPVLSAVVMALTLITLVRKVHLHRKIGSIYRKMVYSREVHTFAVQTARGPLVIVGGYYTSGALKRLR